MAIEMAVSDYSKLAVLDMKGIIPLRSERVDGRFWGIYATKDVEKILELYDSGKMKVSVREFVAALGRVKDRIFERERAAPLQRR